METLLGCLLADICSNTSNMIKTCSQLKCNALFCVLLFQLNILDLKGS